MTASREPANDAAPPAGRAVFRIQLRSGIWGVKLDGKFYGDYRGLHLAMESVDEKARALLSAGREVQILTLSAGGAVLASTELGASQTG